MAKKRRKRKGKMPSALLAYWAGKRRRRVSRKAGSPVASTKKRRRRSGRRRSSSGKFGGKRYARRRGFAFIPQGVAPLIGGGILGASTAGLVGTLLPASSGVWARRGAGVGAAFAGYLLAKRFAPGVARGMLVGAGVLLGMDVFSEQINAAGQAIKNATGLKGLGDGSDMNGIGAAEFDIERTGVGDANYDAMAQNTARG